MTDLVTTGDALNIALMPHLLIIQGTQTGLCIGLDFARLAEKPLVLGRQPNEADVVLISPQNKVSRKHARLIFRPEDELVVLDDAGSSNGTQLNGEYIAGPVALFPGDTIGCGDVKLVFVVPLEGLGFPVVLLPGQTERRYPEDSEPGVGRLEVVATEVPGLRCGAISRLTPGHPFVIGRYSINDLALLELEAQARLVSRRHAEIRWGGNGYIIRDLGAANPAWVNQNQIDGPCQLQDGDRIQIGTTLLVYREPRLRLAAGQSATTHGLETHQAIWQFCGKRALQLGPGRLILPTDRQILIGRNEGNDLRLVDRMVSHRHARLFYEARHFMLVDVGSTNGTRLNGRLIDKPVVLQAGDQVGIGDFEFVFEELLTPIDPLGRLEGGETPGVAMLEPVTLQLDQVSMVAEQTEVETIGEVLTGETVTEVIVHPLRQISPFDELDGVTFRLLLPYFKEVIYKARQVMANEGQNRGAFFAIIEGRVSISRAFNERQRLVLGELESGSVYGERTVFADQRFVNRLEAITAVRALRLEEGAFMRDLSQNATIRRFFEQQVSAASATNWLRATLLMRTLSEKTRRELAKRLRQRVYEPGEVLAEKGQAAEEFFLVLSGTAVANIKDGKGRETYLATLEEGDTFGDGIAAAGETYPTTVRAEKRVECYVLARTDFENVLAKSGDPFASLGAAGMSGLPLGAVLNRVGPFMTLPPQLVTKIAAEMKPKSFRKGETIVSQDEPASAFYIIRSGQVEVSFRTSAGEVRSDMRLGPGQYFGEASLLTNTARTDTVKAIEDCELLALYRNKLDAVLKLGASYDLGQYFARGMNKRFRPKRLPEVVVSEHTSATGEHYFLLARSGGEQFFKLSERSLFLWNLMTGDNSLNDLSMAYFLEFKKLDLEGVSNLVGQLQAGGYLEVPAIDQSLIGGETKRQPGRLFRLFNWRVEVKNIDRWFDRLYEWGGQVFFWRPVTLVMLGLLLGGFGVFLYRGLFDDQAGMSLLKIFQGGGMGAFTIPGALPWWGLVIALIVNFLIHEVAHGLACKYYGRRVLSGGFGLQYGGPVFFVNTNEIWLEKRVPRIVVNLAGPVSNGMFAGVCTLLILITPNAELRTGLFQLAAIAYTLVYININPLMELDGYYALMDWVEIPGLRRKSLTYVRRKLSKKLVSRDVPVRERRIFWWFAGATPVYLVFTVVQFSFFLGSLLGSLGVLQGLQSIGLSQASGTVLLGLVTVLTVGFLAWPIFTEFLSIGRDEEEIEAAAHKGRRRKGS